MAPPDLLLLLCVSAHAGVLDTWGGGENGMAGNTGVATHGAHAAWYNPAMIHADRFDGSGEYVHGDGSLQLQGADKAAGDPSVAPTRGALLGAELNSYWLGLERMNLGAAVFLPAAGPFGWHETPVAAGDVGPMATAPRVGSDLSRLDVAVGGSYWLHDRVSVGASADISASFETLTFIEVTDFEAAAEAPRGQEVTIRPTFHPIVGASVLAGNPEGVRVRLGLVGRTARLMDDTGSSAITLLGADFTYHHHYVRYYAPPTLTIGADIEPLDALSIRLEGSYEAWSQAISPTAETLEGDWVDAPTARIGMRGTVNRLRVLGGYGYDPGPGRSIPRDTLIVDAPSHAIHVGFGAVVHRNEDARALQLMVGLQSRRFVPRSLPTQPQGAVEMSGDLLGLSAGLGWGV